MSFQVNRFELINFALIGILLLLIVAPVSAGIIDPVTGFPTGAAIIDTDTTVMPGEYYVQDLIVTNAATLTLNSNLIGDGFKGVYIHAQKIQVDSNSRISADGTGYNIGPGTAVLLSDSYPGSGYGGKGGGSNVPTYGSALQPTDLGSGVNSNPLSDADRGGGAIRLLVSDLLMVDGTISSDGTADHGVGASGGSIYITTHQLAGSGRITANGANGFGHTNWVDYGSGGGGRIAIYYDASAFTGTVEAKGGAPPVGTIMPGEDGTVVLKNLNQPPIASFTYVPISPTTADNIFFTDTSSDPDGTITSYSWDFSGLGTSDLQNPLFWFYSSGSYTVTLTVTDEDGTTKSTSQIITVAEPAAGEVTLDVPGGRIEGNELILDTAVAGTSVTYAGNEVTIQNNGLTTKITLTEPVTVNAGGIISGTIVSIQIESSLVTDGQLEAYFVADMAALPTDATITYSLIEGSGSSGAAFEAAAVDAGMEVVDVACTLSVDRYNIEDDDSTGIIGAKIYMTIPELWVNDNGGPDAIRIIRIPERGNPEILDTTHELVNGMYTFSAYSLGGLSVFGLVALSAENTPPSLDPIGAKSIDEGQPLSFTITAGDADGDTLTYSATGVPGWATFDTTTKIFSGTPGYNDAGSATVTFMVSDGTLTDTEDVTIIVNNVNRAPELAAIGATTGNEGQQIEFTVSATDPDGDTLTYSTSALPVGAAFDTGTKTFTWTPGIGQAGTYTMTFTVTDSKGLLDSETITITVNKRLSESWDVNIVPNVINLKSNGVFVAFIKVPKPYNAKDVVKETVLCQGTPATRLIRHAKFPQVFGAVFRTETLQGVRPGNKVTFTVTGKVKVKEGFVDFSGSDVVRVLDFKTKIKDESNELAALSDDKIIEKMPWKK